MSCDLPPVWDAVEQVKMLSSAFQHYPPPSIPRKLLMSTSMLLSCWRSDERARRVSSARAERAVQYRFSRMAHAVRLQAALQQQREAEAAAAASSGEAELQPMEAAVSSHINLIIKADVQACALLIITPHSVVSVADKGFLLGLLSTSYFCHPKEAKTWCGRRWCCQHVIPNWFF